MFLVRSGGIIPIVELETKRPKFSGGKRLFTDTVPVNKMHRTDTVPVNKMHLSDTAPDNKLYLIGTRPVNKLHLTGTQGFPFTFRHVGGFGQVEGGMPRD